MNIKSCYDLRAVRDLTKLRLNNAGDRNEIALSVAIINLKVAVRRDVILRTDYILAVIKGKLLPVCICEIIVDTVYRLARAVSAAVSALIIVYGEIIYTVGE